MPDPPPPLSEVRPAESRVRFAGEEQRGDVDDSWVVVEGEEAAPPSGGRGAAAGRTEAEKPRPLARLGGAARAAAPRRRRWRSVLASVYSGWATPQVPSPSDALPASPQQQLRLSPCGQAAPSSGPSSPDFPLETPRLPDRWTAGMLVRASRDICVDTGDGAGMRAVARKGDRGWIVDAFQLAVCFGHRYDQLDDEYVVTATEVEPVWPHLSDAAIAEGEELLADIVKETADFDDGLAQICPELWLGQVEDVDDRELPAGVTCVINVACTTVAKPEWIGGEDVAYHEIDASDINAVGDDMSDGGSTFCPQPTMAGTFTGNARLAMLNASGTSLMQSMQSLHADPCFGVSPRESILKESGPEQAKKQVDLSYPLLMNHLTDFRDRVLREKAKGGSCAVHCNCGKNRSAALCIGYMVLEGWTLEDAVRRVFELRPIVLSNPAFRKQLVELAVAEGRLLSGSRSVWSACTTRGATDFQRRETGCSQSMQQSVRQSVEQTVQCEE
eukprot:TRINITY_DN32501_c0_g1_i1.p1 TRINITY_DN32501_c0_g1~~TRINITY_DN32501_c0_g1_i1.p1  ORF type:complete len:501 (+),score=113.77 TRINITY_DN32501_c0_g1_i1:64-1566(+)